MKEVVIKQNSKKLIMLLLGGVIMLIGLILMLSEEGVFVKAFVIFSILFLSLGLLFIIIRLIKPKDVLIINENGFIDNSTAVSLGFISWEYVDKIYTRSMFSNSIISVDINNIELLIKIKNLSKYKLFILRISKAMGYSSVSIMLPSKRDLANTVNIMNDFFEAYRNKKKIH